MQQQNRPTTATTVSTRPFENLGQQSFRLIEDLQSLGINVILLTDYQIVFISKLTFYIISL